MVSCRIAVCPHVQQQPHQPASAPAHHFCSAHADFTPGDLALTGYQTIARAAVLPTLHRGARRAWTDMDKKVGNGRDLDCL